MECELLINFVLFPTTGDHMASSKAGPSRITELPNELTTNIDTCSPEVSENQPEVLKQNTACKRYLFMEKVGGACHAYTGINTERSPSLSLSSVSPSFCFFIQGIVRTLRQSDAQLFAGWGSHPSIGDTTMLEKIDRLANKAAALLKVLLYNYSWLLP